MEIEGEAAGEEDAGGATGELDMTPESLETTIGGTVRATVAVNVADDRKGAEDDPMTGGSPALEDPTTGGTPAELDAGITTLPGVEDGTGTTALEAGGALEIGGRASEAVPMTDGLLAPAEDAGRSVAVAVTGAVDDTGSAGVASTAKLTAVHDESTAPLR